MRCSGRIDDACDRPSSSGKARSRRYYSFSLALGVVLGILLIIEAFVLKRSPRSIFGEAMMFIYYGYMFPLSTQIAPRFLSGRRLVGQRLHELVRDLGGVVEGRGLPLTLVLISHVKSIARRLDVPGPLYGQARRLLRDRVQAHDIHMGGAGLDLGARDERDSI